MPEFNQGGVGSHNKDRDILLKKIASYTQTDSKCSKPGVLMPQAVFGMAVVIFFRDLYIITEYFRVKWQLFLCVTCNRYM